MAKYQLLLPKMGESVAEATIIKWVKNPGDYIEADDAVIEIATDKVDSEVPSPVSGRLVERLCKEDDIVQVGDVVAIIETDDDGLQDEENLSADTIQASHTTERLSTATQQVTATVEEGQKQSNIPGTELLEKAQAFVPQRSVNDAPRFYSPLVKHIALQENISTAELDSIKGSGSEGRLTKDDLLNYLKDRSGTANGISGQSYAPTQNTATDELKPHTEEIKAQPAPVKETPEPAISAPTQTSSVSGGDEIIEMDRMRRLIADHMVMSKHTSPHVTSFVEADVTSLVLWREKIKNSFEKREGEKITFMPIFTEAVVKAIKDFPLINASVNGTQIIRKAAINISMATALPNGNLIVPVIKKADELNLLGLTKAVNNLAAKARLNKLQPDDVKEGTFTITNVGSFGNLMGTPIINQPQVAILAIGAIKKKPAVIETPEGDVIAIRHMMFLSLSYDHRVVDGALGGSFVKRVADYLENWDINREV
nr:dihydrolipoamide acetyltransferase family protein [uncultured Mucilaginibacter sp.]